jgi:hypothetical protein
MDAVSLYRAERAKRAAVLSPEVLAELRAQLEAQSEPAQRKSPGRPHSTIKCRLCGGGVSPSYYAETEDKRCGRCRQVTRQAERHCPDCTLEGHATVLGRHQKYCPDHSLARHRARTRRWNAKWRDKAEPTPPPQRYCKDCKAPIGPRRWYCDTHRDERARAAKCPPNRVRPTVPPSACPDCAALGKRVMLPPRHKYCRKHAAHRDREAKRSWSARRGAQIAAQRRAA